MSTVKSKSKPNMAGDLVANVVGQFFDGVGGLSGLRKRFSEQDLSHVYQSWLEERHPDFDSEQIRSILNAEIKQLAQRHALEETEVLTILSDHLPTKGPRGE